MLDVQIENRLPPLKIEAQIGVSEIGVGFVTHNGAPVLHDGGLVFVRFSFVTHEGRPVLNDGGLVVLRVIPA